ncbi:MAG TPA: hypothetical protein VK576_05340 [Thermoleophilia bacterium]|nr:hypothetical protein [Thermoleophilia bacterium]
MGIASHAARRLSVLVLLLLLTAGLAALVAAGPAQATPKDPILSLSDLQTMLANAPSGTVDGFFKTVLKGTTIVEIPCTIEGVAPGQADDGGPLIVFYATGPDIDRLGGIAAGMSGSPIYVDDGMGDKLVGAVSYGVYGAGDGFGLATPIERMTSLETPAGTTLISRDLPRPVVTDGGLVKRVVVAGSRLAARGVKPGPDTAVMAPLAELQVTGIPAGSRMFRTMQHLLANEGIDLRSGVLATPTGAAPLGDPIPLDPGASVAAMMTRGDPSGPDFLDDMVYFYGVGGVGTVTYTTDDGQLVAWGHPFYGAGSCDLYMNDATVLDTVPSTDEPFKMAIPGVAPRGEFTTDGFTGIAGTTTATPPEVPITVHAVDSDTGKTVDTTTYVTRWVAGQLQFAGVAPAAIWPALWQAGGDEEFDGTISFHVKITVSDGTHEYVVDRSDFWDSDYDAPTLAYLEIALDMMRLTANVDGIAAPTIESIDFSATLTHQRQRVRVADMAVPGGLHVGANMVHVTLWPYGTTDDRTVDVPLVLPKGTMLSGTLYVTSPYLGIDDLGGGWIGYEDPTDSNPSSRQTLEQIVTAINALPSMNQLQVAYDPDNDEDWGDWDSYWGGSAVVASSDVQAFTMGEQEKRTTYLRLFAFPWSGARARLFGMLQHATGPTTVNLYYHHPGQRYWRLFASGVKVAKPAGGGPYMFQHRLPRFGRTTQLKAIWAGDSAYLGATGKTTLRIGH